MLIIITYTPLYYTYSKFTYKCVLKKELLGHIMGEDNQPPYGCFQPQNCRIPPYIKARLTPVSNQSYDSVAQLEKHDHRS